MFVCVRVGVTTDTEAERRRVEAERAAAEAHTAALQERVSVLVMDVELAQAAQHSLQVRARRRLLTLTHFVPHTLSEPRPHSTACRFVPAEDS